MQVVLEGDRAVGVKTVPTKPLAPGQLTSKVIKARKQIIVSGGTLSSPLILQRSGIGDPEKLRKAGVKPLVDLPGVGLNFQDHYLTFSVFRAKPHVESFDDFVRGDPKVQEQVFNQWNINGTGPLATNGIEAGVKVRPTEEELKQMDSWPCPEFRSGWDSYFKDKPDKPVMHYCKLFIHDLSRALSDQCNFSRYFWMVWRSREYSVYQPPASHITHELQANPIGYVDVDATREILFHVPLLGVPLLSRINTHCVTQPL